ncbi:MAG: hypothetical protein Q8K75_02130 [Chlamydiales bacterium]|nr:hypothetical protein [Chlamydiales bacterium]
MEKTGGYEPNNGPTVQGYFTPDKLENKPSIKQRIFGTKNLSKEGYAILYDRSGRVDTIRSKVIMDPSASKEKAVMKKGKFVPVRIGDENQTGKVYLDVKSLALKLNLSKSGVLMASKTGNLEKMLKARGAADAKETITKKTVDEGARIDKTDQIQRLWQNHGQQWLQESIATRQLNPDGAIKLSRKIFKELPNSLTVVVNATTKQQTVFIHTHQKNEKGDNILGQGAEKAYKSLVPMDPKVGQTVVGMWMMGGTKPTEECARQVKYHQEFKGVGTPILHSFHNYKKDPNAPRTVQRLGLIAKSYRNDVGKLIESKEVSAQKGPRFNLEGMKQVGNAWGRMVSKGYCHCDIKPDNIFYNTVEGKEQGAAGGKSEEMEAVLGDYGAVYQFNTSRPLSNLHKMEGTIDYHAPERKDYDAIAKGSINIRRKFGMKPAEFIVAGDVYALGLTFYEWHTKNSIINEEGRNEFKLFQQHEPQDKGSMEHLIWSMVQTKPKNRPTANEFLRRLNSL